MCVFQFGLYDYVCILGIHGVILEHDLVLELLHNDINDEQTAIICH